MCNNNPHLLWEGNQTCLVRMTSFGGICSLISGDRYCLNSIKLLCLPSETRSTLKSKNCSSFRRDLFSEGHGMQVGSKKVREVICLIKMAENLPHYENTPMQICRKFHLQKKLKNFRQKPLIFSYFCSKHRLWVLVRTALARRF